MRDITFASVFDTPTEQEANLNTVAQTPDGRVWTYLYATEAITKHMITTRPDNTGVDTVSSSSNAASQKVYITKASAGWTVAAYQDHWVIIDDGTGSGQIAKIKDNSADTLELYTDYALGTSLAVADSDITIIHQPDAEMAQVTNQYTPVNGVAQATFASGDYGWFLIKGVGGVILGEAGTEHYVCTPGDDTEGYGLNIDAADTLEEMCVVGRIVGACQDADKANLVDIQIV